MQHNKRFVAFSGSVSSRYQILPVKSQDRLDQPEVNCKTALPMSRSDQCAVKIHKKGEFARRGKALRNNLAILSAIIETGLQNHNPKHAS